MNKRKLVFLGALIFIGIVMSSCRSRNPHCPGVSNYHENVEQPQK